MKADERKALETNDLASGAATLFDGVKSGHLGGSPWAYRVVGLTVSAVLIGGLVWFLLSENKKAASQLWASLDMATPSQLEELAEKSANTPAGQVARLEQARTLLGPEGIGKLNAGDREPQIKGVANIEKARDLFTQLAGDFAKDKTLQATCFAEAAQAELALVGIPKSANGSDSLGTVKAAADLYIRAAQAIGAATPAGEQFAKKAADLTANDAALTKAGLELYSRTMPLPAFDGNRSGAGAGILAPTSLVPKTDLTPGEGVKPPLAPVAPPTPPAGAPVTPAAPPVAPAPAVAPAPPAAPVTPTSKK